MRCVRVLCAPCFCFILLSCSVDVPDVGVGVFACATSDDCVEAYACGVDHQCHRTGPSDGSGSEKTDGCPEDPCASGDQVCARTTGGTNRCVDRCRSGSVRDDCGNDAACLSTQVYDNNGTLYGESVCFYCVPGCAGDESCVFAGGNDLNYDTVEVTCGDVQVGSGITIRGRVHLSSGCASLWDFDDKVVVVLYSSSDAVASDGVTRKDDFRVSYTGQRTVDYTLAGPAGFYAIQAFLDRNGDGNWNVDIGDEPVRFIPELEQPDAPPQVEYYGEDKVGLDLALECAEQTDEPVVACTTAADCGENKQCSKADLSGTYVCTPTCSDVPLDSPCETPNGSGVCLDIISINETHESVCVECSVDCFAHEHCGLRDGVIGTDFDNLATARTRTICKQ